MIKLIICCCFVLAFGNANEDLIEKLPELNFEPNFKQYSGYLNADNVSFLHYWFVESQKNSSEDPLLLWLNGGPGCSSLLGLLTENGPFRVSHVNKSVYENVYAWNKFLNVLYIESPSVVGFSYSNKPNISFDDDTTALLNYRALKQFFLKFPEYKSRDFYVSGESYAGIYLPTLALHLIKDQEIKKNFKGMLIGNGYMSDKYLANSIVPLVYDHCLLGEKQWKKLIKTCCDGNAMNCDYYEMSQTHDICSNLLQKVMDSLNSLDPYNLYDTCYIDDTQENNRRTVYFNHFYKRMFKNQTKKLARNEVLKTKSYPDCYYPGEQLYLERHDVRKALHIPDFVPQWNECANDIQYRGQYTSMADNLDKIILSKVRFLSYNGDVDTVCNAIGNKQFIASLNLKPINNTDIWTYASDKITVAGLQTLYEGADFLSIRGAGHMVPSDRPREALQMIFNFVNEKPYSAPVTL